MALERGLDTVVSEVVSLLEAARKASARSVNAILTETYWEIGRRIVEEEQQRRSRKAEYGKALVTRLAQELTARFGRGFSRRSIFKMRAFYVAYRDRVDALSPRVRSEEIVPTARARSRKPASDEIVPPTGALSSRFPLPWRHYVELLALDSDARSFYEAEALRGGWTRKQLERQISTQFYERTVAARGKRAAAIGDVTTAEEELKDPYILEFLGLKDEDTESDVEDALVRELETFLLELGGHFAFIGRQRRLRVGDQWHRIDLLLFHRRLRCLVVIDLKLGALTGADAGQMHLYLNYVRENWTLPDENPPVGLILSGKRNAAVAHYALDGLPNQIIAAQYRLVLPEERILAERINRTWRLLEARPKRKK